MMEGIVERLLAPDFHDPACPFDKHCYCGDDHDPAPHDIVRHPLAAEAAGTILAHERTIQSLQADNAALRDGFGKAWEVLTYVAAASECEQSRKAAVEFMAEIDRALIGEQS